MNGLRRERRQPAPPPVLDAFQESVVTHPAGPLLVLGGPGTGKTTALVESVVDRISRRKVPPDRVLVLTFSRRAAQDLRSRITARQGRSVVTPVVLTFHAFCYGLLRRFGDGQWGPGRSADVAQAPVRLLTGPEQEFRIRETLAGSNDTLRVQWPGSLEPAFGTRAFAAEVRSVVARSRQLGMDPSDISAAGQAAGRPEWVAIGEYFEEYLDVLDAEQVIDYAELVHRCRILLADPAVADRLRSEIVEVFVDEYQDTDPAQVRLLQAIAGAGRNLVVFADPDQSVYAFRGADVAGVSEFADRFRTVTGEPAPVVPLGLSRRSGRALLAATRRVSDRLALPNSIEPGCRAQFRAPVAATQLPPGRVEVYTYDSPGAEADQIAELLRTAHLRDQVPWEQMAVLVRSGRAMLPGLTRALGAAGVPVEVAGDEIALAIDPTVAPLLLALRVATNNLRLDPDDAQLLLTSPLARLDAMAVRRLGRALRQAERAELAGTALPRPSGQLLAAALRQPSLLAELATESDSAVLRAAIGLAELLHRAARDIAAGATAEEALWTLWSGTQWPDLLRRQARLGGEPGRRANRDLDAICALFEVARRSAEVAGLRGVAGFLGEIEGQQIPADTYSESDLRGGSVRLVTAHRAKGLEWDLVVVAGVQEGSWPDIRRRGSLLEPDRLGPRGLVEIEPTAGRIADERRLFYVACTRARNRLIVTAVAGTEGQADQPSRFMTELGVPLKSVPGRPRRPLTMTALIAELRRTSADPQASPALQQAAAARLAQLAELTDERGRQLVPAADPANWWGMREVSDLGGSWPQRDTTLRSAEVPPVTASSASIALSGSQLSGLLGCPRRWFLSRKGRADPPRSAAATFGSVLHVLADHGSRAGVTPADLSAHLDTVWDQLSFDANWLSAVERAEAESALDRFVSWQRSRPELELLGTEVRFQATVDLGAWRQTSTYCATLGDAPDFVGVKSRQGLLSESADRTPLSDSSSALSATSPSVCSQRPPFNATLLSSDRVLLTGTADRVERNPDGRIRIVDFKTSRTAPQASDVAVQDQLGVYQLAVQAGGFASVAGPNAQSGGAELVYLRLDDGTGLPTSYHQPSLADVPFPAFELDDGPEPDRLPQGLDRQPTWVHRRLAIAAQLVRNERFVARPGPGCRWCVFVSSCPAQSGGQQLVS